MVLTAINITQLWAICIALKKNKKKHLNGVICTFQSLPLHFAVKSLIRHWSEPEVWRRAGHTLSASAVIIQPGNCQEIEWQTELKINPCQTLRHTLSECLVHPLHQGGVCVALCGRVCTFSRADTCEMQVGWEGWGGARPRDICTHTHTHADLRAGQTDCRPCDCTKPYAADGWFYLRWTAHTVRCCHAVETCLDPPSFFQ